MGSVSEFQAAIRAAFISTTCTSIFGAFSAIIAMVGPPTYPAPIQQIFIGKPARIAGRTAESKPFVSSDVSHEQPTRDHRSIGPKKKADRSPPRKILVARI